MPKELTPEESSTKENYDKYAEGWARWWERDKGSNIVSKETSQFRELLPKGRILEIGSGPGQAAGWFVANGYDYLGTDISSGMLEQARKNNPGIRFDEISVYDLNFDEPFDGFWCSAVLLHIPKNRLNEALTAIHKNIKEGAYGYISMKDGDCEIMERDGRFHAYWLDKDFSQQLKNNDYRVIERNTYLIKGIHWLRYIVQKDSSQDSNSRPF